MVGKVIVSFAALVGLYFVLMYPGHVVDILQLFVDGAHKAARALRNLNLHA
jgi:hypothetical protein